MRCTGCGSSNLVQGTLVGGNEQPTSFAVAGRSRWTRVLGVGNRKVFAFACIHCGNVQQQVRVRSLLAG